MSGPTECDLIEDLRFQLQLEHIDWEYFIETAIEAKNAQEEGLLIKPMSKGEQN